MNPTIYNLRLYLRDGPNLFFIDEEFSRDKEELKTLAIERKSQNSQYISIILILKPIDAIIL